MSTQPNTDNSLDASAADNQHAGTSAPLNTLQVQDFVAADAPQSAVTSGQLNLHLGGVRPTADSTLAAAAAQPKLRRSPGPTAIAFEDVVTGRFDADEDAQPSAQLVQKRVLLPQAESPKLHKVLAQAGLGSRLEMEQLILQGRISVNGEPAHVGQRIQFGDNLKVNGKPIRVRIDPPPARVIAYHKPAGEVVTHDDPQNRPTVFRRLPKLFQGKWQSVGRLDLNTEGLLLLTSSGELANRLMHPRFGLEREYAVRVLGALANEEKKRLLEGVTLDDGLAQFGSIEAGGGEGANCWYRVTISEGRNREVRRLFEAVGHAVSRLIRIRYGAMLLPRGLRRGAFVELDERDIKALTGAASQAEARGLAARDAVDSTAGRAPDAAVRDNGPRRDAGRTRLPQRPSPGLADAQVRAADPRGRPSSTPQQRYRDERAPRAGAPSGGSNQPDPLKTSFGYIGADTFTRQRQAQGQRRSSGNGSGSGPAGGTRGAGTNRSGGGRGGSGQGGGRGSSR